MEVQLMANKLTGFFMIPGMLLEPVSQFYRFFAAENQSALMLYNFAVIR